MQFSKHQQKVTRDGYRLRMRAKLERYPAPIRAAGFTLIELSIVLVIIGLIVGGVLVGQDLIEAAKNRAQISQLHQFDVAANTYRVKYNALPGDDPKQGGDNDKKIESLNANTVHAATHEVSCYSGELANVFAHMFSDTYTGGTYTTGSTTVVDPMVAGTNVPKAEIADNAVVIAASIHGNPGSKNYYNIIIPTISSTAGGFTRFTSTVNGNVTMTPSQLRSMDDKIDDGNADTGAVVSGSYIPNPVYAPATITSLQENALCSSSGTYNISTTTKACTPFIKTAW